MGSAARSPMWALGEGQQLGFGRAGAGLELHVGDRHLAGMRVGPADRGGDLHGRMPVQRLFDARRIDVVAAADDQLLLAAGQPEVAVRVLAAEVAGVQPAPAVAGIEPEPSVVLGAL